MKPSNSEVFEQIKDLDFVKNYAKEYAGACQFNEESIKVEIWDEFEQCSVWLGFEDQFAIRDAFGSWREATAEECLQLKNGKLPGSMTLVN